MSELPVAREGTAWGDGLTDEEIVRRVRAGDGALYEILMRRHNRTLYRAVRAILRDESEIEDVLQDAYWAAYRRLAEFEGRARFSTWLVRIAVNKAIDVRRRRGLVVADGGAARGPGSRDDPERRSARRELAIALEEAIDALPDVYRIVYVLRDLEGASTEDTAESLGLEPGTVKTRLHRARALLRERLARDFDAAALHAFPFGGERCDRLVAGVLARLDRGP